MSDTPRTDEEMKRIISEFDGVEDDVYYAMDQMGKHARELERELAQRTAERDEARRRICNDSLRMGRVFRRIEGQNVECSTPQDVAEMMGWDCFKENNK